MQYIFLNMLKYFIFLRNAQIIFRIFGHMLKKLYFFIIRFCSEKNQKFSFNQNYQNRSKSVLVKHPFKAKKKKNSLSKYLKTKNHVLIIFM